MKNIELHTVDSEADIDLAMIAGLLGLDEIDGVSCSACQEEVGVVNGGFHPYVIVLDDRDQWYVCSYCAESVIDPELLESIQD
jgi:hypothetical protein